MCQCTPEIRSMYCDKCRPLEEKLRTMPIKDLRAFVDNNFHSIKHTKSFIILINRLEQMEEKLSVASKIFERIFKLLGGRK